MPPLSAEAPQSGDPAPPIPADDMLLAFLRSKLAGEALPSAAGAHFHDADIYVADPATLTAGYQPISPGKCEGGSWLFFTHVRPKSSSDSRKSRMVAGGAGTWHSERAPRAVCDGEGNCVGRSQYFSYKRKTGKNCSERTDWYMVEFSDGQEGDHDRVHGGEPVLVLCKIYKAHSGSRSSSSSSSRSVRKRKATNEHANQSSDLVKAKRRLFNSSAPAPPAASQEQVSSRSNLETYRLEWQGDAAKFDSEACLGEIGGRLDDLVFCASQCKKNDTSDCLKSYPNSEASASQSETSTAHPSSLTSETEMSQDTIGSTLDDLIFWPEPEALQDMLGSSSEYAKFSTKPEAAQDMQNMSSTTPHSLLMSESEMMFQEKIGGSSDYLRFCSEPEALQGMIDKTSDYLKFHPEPEGVQNMTSKSPPSMLMSEPETTQGEIGGTPDFFRFWPETEATQKIGGTSDDLKFSPETETIQKTSSTPCSLLMFEPEVPARQDESETATFNWGIQIAGSGTTCAPAHCYEMTDLLDDRYWRDNDNSSTGSCSRGVGWTVGAPPAVWSIPRFPSSPSMLGGPVLWSC
ncbi:unnamed protein product [Urochloa humidicola]